MSCEKELLIALIGKNSKYYLEQFDRIDRGKVSFNLGAFMFAMIVLLYRKQYLYFIKFILPVCAMPFLFAVLVHYVKDGTLAMTLSDGIAYLWLISIPVVGIICGLGFNKNYKKHLESIIIKHQINIADEKTIKKYKPSVLIPIIIVILYSIILMIVSSNEVTQLTGKYVNPDDNSTYVMFDGNKVMFYESGNQTRSGKYRVSTQSSSGRYLIICEINNLLSTEYYWLDEKKEIIYETISEITEDGNALHTGEIAFIK